MFELNDQEIEQVTGGSHHGSHASTGGYASAYGGFVLSKSVTYSTTNASSSSSFAANKSLAAGYGVYVESGAESGAGSSSGWQPPV